MSWSETDAAEAREYAREQRRRQTCQCGSGLPGVCPGPLRCPYSDYNNPVDDDEGQEEDTECSPQHPLESWS